MEQKHNINTQVRKEQFSVSQMRDFQNAVDDRQANIYFSELEQGF